MQWGSLPLVLLSDDPWQDLKAYTDTYLKEEIEEVAAVRNPVQFVRFLKISALQSGELLNYAAVSSDSGTPETTVRAYFEILKGTLIGYPLEPWRESKNGCARSRLSSQSLHFRAIARVTQALRCEAGFSF